MLAAYDEVKLCGRGKYSLVYRAKRLRDGTTVALKRVRGAAAHGEGRVFLITRA